MECYQIEESNLPIMQLSFLNNEVLQLIDGELQYFHKCLPENDANLYFQELLQQTPWQQDHITVFGKTHPQPRLTALYGDKTYSYSNITMTPIPFTETLYNIKMIVETITKESFNICLLNLYRNGNDSNGWHSDNEKSLGNNPIIASLSLGATRAFHLKHKSNKNLKYKLPLTHNSLLVMKGETQHYWKHQIPKTKNMVTERINITFRKII